MGERRVDRVERLLRGMGGRARLQDLLNAVRQEEGNSDLPYQSLYIAIQFENERLAELGDRPRFVTSKDGEDRGWVRLREASEFLAGSGARTLEQQIQEANERVDEEIRAWLQAMDWRAFESTFLARILEALGFQDVQITQATRDGGVDARVTYKRGIVEGKAIVSAKRWKQPVQVAEIRALRGIKGDEDTALIITTAKFSPDAKAEAKPSQNQRAIYLVDGEQLVDVCKRHQIGVKKLQLPDLLVLDPEITRGSPTAEEEAAVHETVQQTPDGGDVSVMRLRDEMLGDSERGLSAKEIADLTGYSINTVRNYLSSHRRGTLGDAIRSDAKARARALTIVSRRRTG